MDPATDAFRAPYMPFATFWGFVEGLAARPLPPRIDRSLMASRSGTDQQNLTACLRTFGLMGNDGTVLPPLVELAVSDESARTRRLEALWRQYYPDQIEVSEQHGTEQHLREVFRKEFPTYSAEVVRKAMTFFVHGAKVAGIDISANFQVRAGSAGTRKGTAKAVGNGSKTAPNRVRTPPGAPPGAGTTQHASRAGDSHVVTLASGGTVSVVVSVDLFGLTKVDRDFVLELVDKLKGYPQPTPEPEKETPE